MRSTPSEESSDNLAASCKAAARLMSEARDRELDEIERVDLEMHWLECRNCTQFNAQLDWLSQLAKNYAAGAGKAKV